jgi:hypothetical protein
MFQVTVSSLGEAQGNEAEARMGRKLSFVSTPYDSLDSRWLEEEWA